MATFMSIVKYEVDETTGAVRFISGFTKPYGHTHKTPKAKPKQLDLGELDEEVVEL